MACHVHVSTKLDARLRCGRWPGIGSTRRARWPAPTERRQLSRSALRANHFDSAEDRKCWQHHDLLVGKRHVLISSVVSLLQLGLTQVAVADQLESKMVGAYLPQSSSAEGLYVFHASAGRTPALRAGALEQYTVSLPADWKEVPISNAKSGNYCQPRCDEATTEVSFGSAEQGVLQVIIIPTTKLLISKKDPSLEDVGNPIGILNAVSPAITGSVAIEEEDIVNVSEKKSSEKTYYQYELYTPYAQNGEHNLTTVCTSKNYLVIATISATEKQWMNHEQVLKSVLNSFHVGS